MGSTKEQYTFDKRKFLRFDTYFDARYRLPHEERFIRLPATKDVSKEGMCIYTDESISPGTSLEIELAIPGDLLPLSLRGLSVWSRRDREKEGKFRTGVWITAIDGFDRSRMLDYAYTKWVEAIKQ